MSLITVMNNLNDEIVLMIQILKINGIGCMFVEF